MDCTTIADMLRHFMEGIVWLANFFVVLIAIYDFWKAFITKRVTVISINSKHGEDGNNEAITLKNHALRDIYLSEASER